MAKSNNNALTFGLSGTVGGILVFRQKNGKTIVAKRPVPNKNVSEKQAAHREHFQQAVIYGSAAAKAPETKDLYATAAKKAKGVTAFNVAVADYCNAPDIKDVDLSKYAGNVGDTIRIIANDDFAVKSVAVSITNADGSPVEEGLAVQSVGSLWIYTATQINDNLEGDKIVVAVSDLPGNVTQKEMEVN